MAGFFDAVTEFFLGILGGDPQSARARKRLRELATAVAEFKPPVYSRQNDTVLPALAQAWLQLYQLVTPLADLFSKTIGHSDRKIAELSQQWLIEAALDGNLPDRRVDLNYTSLLARFSASEDAEHEAALASQDFASLLNDLRRQDTDKWQKDLASLYRLRFLVAHSYAPFFRRFGFELATLGTKTPTFRPVAADELLPELVDLYYLLAGLEITPGAELLLGLLLEKASPSKAQENRQKVGKLIEKLRDLLRSACSAGVTLNVIRLVRKDPDVIPDAMVIKDRYVADYANVLSNRFASDRERALREQTDTGLEKDLAALFPDAHLLELPHYSQATNERLNAVGLPALSWVKPLQILRSFAYAVLKTRYLDAVKLVVLNGFFDDKLWQSQLGTDLLAAEKIATVLEEFDASLNEEGKATLVSLEKYFSGQVAPSALSRQLVEKINHNASAVLESQVRVLNSLSVRVLDVLNDFKAPQPLHVTNIRGLGGKDQRDMMESLVMGYNKSAQVLKILKNFVVVKG